MDSSHGERLNAIESSLNQLSASTDEKLGSLKDYVDASLNDLRGFVYDALSDITEEGIASTSRAIMDVSARLAETNDFMHDLADMLIDVSIYTTDKLNTLDVSVDSAQEQINVINEILGITPDSSVPDLSRIIDELKKQIDDNVPVWDFYGDDPYDGEDDDDLPFNPWWVDLGA